MAYFVPYIDATGMHIPTYKDIVDDLVAKAQNIYGPDIYLGNDSQDYEWISVVSDKVYDAYQLAQAAYNAQRPSAAVGVGLDLLLKLNGLKRDQGSYSTCPVTLTGTAGTTVTNAVAQDKSGYKWSIPTFTIGAGGTVTATATCTVKGPIVANIGDINQIVTPTYGWTAVNNDVSAATVGTNKETDPATKGRQAISTAKPSRSLLEGTKGAIAEITGVTRYEVYENDTNATDSNGVPAHSICAIIEGGADADIYKAIFARKGPGCGTHGTSNEDVIDAYGQATPINWFRPAYQDIDVVINIKMITTYTPTLAAAIKQAVADYLNSLAIGDDLTISSLWGAALGVMVSLAKPSFSITGVTACIHGGSPGTSDIVIAFNEAARGNVSYITLNVA